MAEAPLDSYPKTILPPFVPLSYKFSPLLLHSTPTPPPAAPQGEAVDTYFPSWGKELSNVKTPSVQPPADGLHMETHLAQLLVVQHLPPVKQECRLGHALVDPKHNDDVKSRS